MDTPDVSYDTSERIYTEEEARKLLKPHEDVDWRVTLAANVACDTGRRIGAICQLSRRDMAMRDGRLFLHFRAEVEKGGRGSWVPVSDETARLLADALERKPVQKAGLLFPGGDRYRKSYWSQPIGSDSMIAMLHDAEDTLGIERVKHRAYHGIKRLHVTLGFEVSGGDETLVGDVTGNVSPELLRRVYRQQDRARITRQVDAVRGRIMGRETGEDGSEDGNGDGGL